MKRGPLMAGFTAALIAGFLVGLYVGLTTQTRIRTSIMAQTAQSEPKVQILAAMRDLSAGIALKSEDLAIREGTADITIPARRCLAPDHADGVIGRDLLCDVKKGEPILPSYIAGDEKSH